MPMYNFDPQEEEDWEAELLDDRGRRVIFRDTVSVILRRHSISPNKGTGSVTF